MNLTTKYTNNIYTHLTTQEYSIPTNATARLSFRSWVCGSELGRGGVAISTDGGKIGGGFLPNSTGSTTKFYGEHEFSTLRRGHHRWFQCSQRVRCFQPRDLN